MTPEFERQHTMKYAIDLACELNASAERIVEPTARYTGERVNREARSFAQALGSIEISKGDVVALLGPSSCRFIAAYFAVHKLGAVTCNLHFRESASYLCGVLQRIEAKALVCDECHLALASEAMNLLRKNIPIVSLGDTRSVGIAGCYGDFIEQFPADEPVVDVSPQDTAVILLSSGSTGAPKGILHNNWNYVRWLQATPALFGPLSPSTRYLVIVGTSFAAWAFSAVPPFFAGGTIVLLEPFDPRQFASTIEAEKITMVGTVPTVVRLLDRQLTENCDLSSLDRVLICGESPSDADIERIRAWGDNDIRVLYLASETANATSAYWELADQVRRGKPVCAGRPIPGAAIRVVDPDGGINDLVPVGESGEIALRGPTLALGYLKDDALTARKFIDGWWRSGDVGRLDEDGYLFVEGRTDNMIISGGLKVYAEEIENCLVSHPAVSLAAVTGVPDDKWGQRIEANLVLSEEIAEQELDEFCRQHLAAFKCPKRYLFHTELPTGITGKLDRRALRNV